MSHYQECWVSVATSLFAQALAGEPELSDALPKPMAQGMFGFAAKIAGEEEGTFSVWLDPGVLETPFLGEGVDQKAGWAELLREVAEAAVGELLARHAVKARVEQFDEAPAAAQMSRAMQLKSAAGSWMLMLRDEVRAAAKKLAEPAVAPEPALPKPAAGAETSAPPGMRPGMELLLDVELEASLRFGCRELPLSELMDLGPGDVVELDRHVADPVDLIVGDKIVARGEVVLVNGNFALRVTAVEAPRKRLESIRCLF